MAYSYINGGRGFRSHLTNKEYVWTTSDERHSALAEMLLDDQAVRDMGKKGAEAAGMKRPVSDREIATGNWVNDSAIDRRTTAERVADQVASRGPQEVTHDPYQAGIDSVRAAQRLTDGAAKREADQATIERLEAKSAEWQQLKSATPPAAEPNTPAEKAVAFRKAAEELRPRSGMAEDQAAHRRAVDMLLKRADALDAQAVAESERAAKAKMIEWAVVDCDATLFLIAKDQSIPQETVNAVRAMREKLVNLEVNGTEWIAFANGVDETRKQIRADKIAAKNAEIKAIEDQKTAMCAGTDQDPPAPVKSAGGDTMNFGIIRHVNKSGEFCFATVVGHQRGVFLHCSQMQPPAKFAPESAGRVVRYDHVQNDRLGRPQIIGARFEPPEA